MARASATRWRWPPDSAAGPAVEEVGRARPSRRRAAPARRARPVGTLAHPEREADVLVDRHVRVEPVALEHHRDVAVLGLEVVDHAGRRSRSRPRSRPRARRSSAWSWSCRSPRGRAAPGTRWSAMARSRSSTPTKPPQRLVTPLSSIPAIRPPPRPASGAIRPCPPKCGGPASRPRKRFLHTYAIAAARAVTRAGRAGRLTQSPPSCLTVEKVSHGSPKEWPTGSGPCAGSWGCS